MADDLKYRIRTNLSLCERLYHVKMIKQTNDNWQIIGNLFENIIRKYALNQYFITKMRDEAPDEFEFYKEIEANFVIGDAVYWNDATQVVTDQSAGNTWIGVSLSTVFGDDDTARILLTAQKKGNVGNENQ